MSFWSRFLGCCRRWKHTAREGQGKVAPGTDGAGAELRRAPPEEVVAGLREQLAHPHAEKRRIAAKALGQLGPAAIDATADLVVSLADPHAEVREAAQATLELIEPRWPATAAARKAVPRLIEQMLAARSAEAWRHASATLVHAGASAVPALIRVLETRNEEAPQFRTVATLGRIGQDAADALPALEEALGSEAAYVRQAAAEALGHVAPAAAESIASLVTALDDQDAGVREAAAVALSRFGRGAASAAEALVLILPDPDEPVRRAAVEALTRIGAPAVSCLARLVENPQGQWDRQREESLRHRVQEPFVFVKSDSLEAVRREPAKAFRNVKWHAWQELADHRLKLEARTAAIRVLGHIGPEAGTAISTLSLVLDDDDPDARVAALEALGRIGPAACGAVPAIEKAMADEHEAVRSAASRALERIAPTGDGPHQARP